MGLQLHRATVVPFPVALEAFLTFATSAANEVCAFRDGVARIGVAIVDFFAAVFAYSISFKSGFALATEARFGVGASGVGATRIQTLALIDVCRR